MLKTDINIEHYNYSLPEDRIAKYPLQNREASNLLVYKNGEISDKKFYKIGQKIKSKISSSYLFGTTAKDLKTKVTFSSVAKTYINQKCSS